MLSVPATRDLPAGMHDMHDHTVVDPDNLTANEYNPMYVANLFAELTQDVAANYSTYKLSDDKLLEVARESSDQTTISWVRQGHDPAN